MNAMNEKTVCDLLVIGTGMAGMAASLFAAQDGVDTIQVGVTGEINFASGLLDLLGVHPVPRGTILDNPWAGIERLIRDEPLHPYARAGTDTIRKAVKRYLDFWNRAGYPYHADPEKNLMVVTPAGTIKPTYAVPHTMRHGIVALSSPKPCLLVDFKGLKGYSARQIALGAAGSWKAAPHTVGLTFPDLGGELYAERMARALEAPDIRKKLADTIRPHIRSASAVGLPAVLGIYRTQEIVADLNRQLGVAVFEIPTMLPAVTGLRLRETFEQRLPAAGIKAFYQQRVLCADRTRQGDWLLGIGPEKPEQYICAKTVILASGRFLGKGLHAERNGVRETIFDLPVHQPPERGAWHHKDLLHKDGHPVNRAGVSIDDRFRPTDGKGQTLYSNLFAAGSILAHQDWVRQKCGSGIAIATAYGAVQACQTYLGG